MRKRVSLFAVLAVGACLLIAFLWVSSKLDRDLQDANLVYQQTVATGTTLENEQNRLKNTLANANTDAFIENQARTLYDYMMPDDIRFVITNPEALYGTER